MAHDLEINANGTANMFSVREQPWHKLGVVLDEAPKNAQEALEAAGLDWTVSMRPVFDEMHQEILSHKVITRDSDGRKLGIVSSRFGVVQNAEAFSMLDDIVAAGEASWETAGSLSEGRRVWGMVKVNGASFEVLKGDEIETYAFVSLAHDGSSSIKMAYTPIRIVCANTLAAAKQDLRFVDATALSDEEVNVRAISVRHTANVKRRLEQAKKALGFVREQAKETARVYQQLAKVTISTAQADEFLRRLLPIGDNVSNGWQVERARKEIIELSNSDLGAELAGGSNNLWGLINGVSAFVCYGRGNMIAGVDDKAISNETRVNALVSGSGQRLMQRSVSLALAMA